MRQFLRKSPFLAFWLWLILLLVGCNFSLAADITPPPDYRSPTPPPTLGPLYPNEPPNVERGKAIYIEKCLPCHGESGLGDGPQGKQLPVRVTALGLPEVARPARLDRWFTVVTQGNLERFMPPFMSLSAQERWDVVAYALTLHTSPQEVEGGRQIFERLCAACDTRIFRDQERMAALSNQDLFNWLTKGSDEFRALSGISETDAWKVVAYLRSLSFSIPQAAPPPTQEVGTPTVAETAAPGALAGTPVSATEMPEGGSPATGPIESAAAAGSSQYVVQGVVEAADGTQLPSSLQITLRGYDHDPNAMPTEKVTLTTSLNPDGSYRFEGVEMPAGRIFAAEVDVNGVRYRSPFAVIAEGETELNLSPIRIYPVTEDFSALRITQTHVQVDVGDGQLQVFMAYSILNSGEQTVLVRTDGASLPFLRFPANASQTGVQLAQDSAPLLDAGDGFAMPPSADPYGFIAFYLLPYQNNRAEVEQPFVLASDSVIIILPEGMSAKGEGLWTPG
ncbi:MAG: c-type cytochrome, partial [Anaerolineales bacterium]